jgi:hypothetical protein
MNTVREVAFELEAFEWSEDRLDVAGRWQGLTGRRLARPVLTVQLDSGRRKRLVAMPGGQLGAAGESWHASFSWPGDPAEIVGAELELGRNVVVELPLPDRKRRRRRRHAVAEAQEQSSVTEELRLEAGALRAQVDRLRAELAGRERELIAAREQLEAQPVPDQATMELRRIEAAAAEREDLDAERKGLDAEREGLAAERADLAGEVERLRAEHEQERAHWQEEIDALREGFAAAAEEAEQTRRRHAAEVAALQAEAAKAGERRRLHGRHQAHREPERFDEEITTDEATASTAGDIVADSVTDDWTGAADDVADTVTDDRTTTADPEATVADAAARPQPEDGEDPAMPPPATAAGAAGPVTAPFVAVEPEAGQPDGREEHEEEQEQGPSPLQQQLQQLRERVSDLWSGATNGHHPPPADDDPPAQRATRSAMAARARAGASVAARRSNAEVWAMRAVAAVVVLVLLITFVLLITSLA